jgi:DNA-binding NarL/FixJ family response regulator
MNNSAEVIVMQPVNIALVNLSAINADLLRLAFAAEKGVRVAGCAATLGDLQPVFAKQRVDVALVGSRGVRQESTAIPFLEQISCLAPSPRQIVVSEDMGREDVASLFRAGARGLVCGSQSDVQMLMKCIRCVAAGEIWANGNQLDQLVRSLTLPRSLKVTNVLGDSLLSQREEQVLQLLADGLSNRELAKTLKLSEHTVKNHLFRIFDKLGVSSRMEAVLYAISQREQRVSARPAAGSKGATILRLA